MSTNITDVSAFTDPVRTVADGDAANATNFALAPQDLANRTRYLLDWVTAGFQAVGAGTTIAADTNDFSPTGFATKDVIEISATGATRNITGITSTARVGKPLTLKVATGSQNITFTHADAASAAASRILTAGEKKQRLKPGDTIIIVHNGTNWQQIGGTCKRLETLDFNVQLTNHLADASWDDLTYPAVTTATNSNTLMVHLPQLIDGDTIVRMRAGAARGSATGATGMRLRLRKFTLDKTPEFDAPGATSSAVATATGTVSVTDQVLSISPAETVSGDAATYYMELVAGDAAATLPDAFHWGDMQVERYV